jgi:F-type H+-transporting ATPase subunit delta
MSFPIQVASRYAKSLLTLAQEKNLVEDFRKDFATYMEVFHSNYDFNLLMHSPIVQKSKKIAIVNKIFANELSAPVMSFITLIIKKGRENGLDEISTEFLRQYDLFKQVQKAKVVSASPLTVDARKNIEALVVKHTGKKVELIESVDNDLIGGFVLTIDDIQIDNSVKAQLRKIKNSIS